MDRIKNDIYRIKGDGSDISLTVTIGYQQSGNLKIYIENRLHYEGRGSTQLNLGSDQDLNMKDLKIEGYIQDIQTTFDHVSMTMILTGGIEIMSWTVGSKSEDGKVYYLKIGITFID